MRKWPIGVAVLAVLFVLAASLTAPPPAQAFSWKAYGEKIIGTAVDSVGIAAECPKVIGQEVTRWKERFVVGVPFTTAAGCVASTVVRAGSTAVDWVTNIIPVTDQHVAKPRSWENVEPLVSIPK